MFSDPIFHQQRSEIILEEVDFWKLSLSILFSDLFIFYSFFFLFFLLTFSNRYFLIYWTPICLIFNIKKMKTYIKLKWVNKETNTNWKSKRIEESKALINFSRHCTKSIEKSTYLHNYHCTNLKKYKYKLYHLKLNIVYLFFNNHLKKKQNIPTRFFNCLCLLFLILIRWPLK